MASFFIPRLANGGTHAAEGRGRQRSGIIIVAVGVAIVIRQLDAGLGAVGHTAPRSIRPTAVTRAGVVHDMDEHRSLVDFAPHLDLFGSKSLILDRGREGFASTRLPGLVLLEGVGILGSPNPTPGMGSASEIGLL